MRPAISEGTKIIVRYDDGRDFRSIARSEPWELGHGDQVVAVEGIAGGYALSRVSIAMDEASWEALPHFKDRRTVAENDQARAASGGSATGHTTRRMTCTEPLYEHTQDCDSPAHCAALARRREGAAKWGQITRGKDRGGMRDFLDGEPLNCGTILEMQTFDLKSDDYGDYSVLLNKGVRVRYELDGGRVVLHATVGGFEFTKRLDEEPSIGFRVPKRGGAR